MFWDRWIPEKHHVKTEICAVDVCFGEETTTYYHTLLKSKSGRLELGAVGYSTGKAELPEVVGKNKIPLAVVISGKGVIYKKIALNEGGPVGFDEIVRQHLPAINPPDFYIQLFRQDDATAFISLCRKEQANKEMENFRNQKYELAALFIGIPAILGLQPLWSSFNSLPAGLHQVELSNNNIDTISPREVSANTMVSIDALSFDANYTLGFAVGLAYLLQRPLFQSESPEILGLGEAHRNKNKFRFLLVAVVALAFIMAVANVIFYTSYFDRNDKLDGELSVYQGKYEKINQLLSEYQKNKDLIENAGVLNRNKLSEYADRIGQTLPDEVVLSELYFNPKKENEESVDSLITFETKHITLRGNCGKSLIVNEWVNVLKMQKFVKDVSLEKFIYNSDGIVPNFEIKLVTE